MFNTVVSAADVLRPVAALEREDGALPTVMQEVERNLNGAPAANHTHPALMNRVEAVMYKAALEATGGKKMKAAALLGVHINNFSKNLKKYSERGWIPDNLSPSWRAAFFRNGALVDLREIRGRMAGMLCRAALDATRESIPGSAKLLGISRDRLRRYKKDGAIPEEIEEEWWKPIFEEIISEQSFKAGVNIFDMAALLGIRDDVLCENLLEHRTDVVSAEPDRAMPKFQEALFIQDGRPIAIDKFTGMLCRLALDQAKGNVTKAAALLKMSRITLNRYRRKGIIPDNVEDKWKKLLIKDGQFLTIGQVTRILYKVALDARSGNETRAARLLGVVRNTLRKCKEQNLLPSTLDAEWQAVFFETEGLIPGPAPMDHQIVAFIDWIGDKKIKWLSDEHLKDKTKELKAVLQAGASLNGILPEAFAVFREAVFRSKGKYSGNRPSAEQILAALAVHRGMAVEELPGEGKTLAIAMAAYLNALTGKGVHVHTFNDFLAKRDGQEMGTIFDSLGLTTGVAVEGRSYFYVAEYNNRSRLAESMRNLSRCTRHEAYLCDVTYGEKDEFVFDYLRGQMVLDRSERTQPIEPPEITIVDEGDSSLIDEGYQPLIISMEANGFSDRTYVKIYKFISENLREGEDYEVDNQGENIILKEPANGKIGELFAGISETRKLPYEERVNLVCQALKARHFYHRNEDYVVKGYKIVIVDEFTGRCKRQHMWGNFIHQFVQVKENVRITPNFIPSAMITYQSYYRRMKRISRLSVISGTIGEDAKELNEVYDLAAVGIPLQQMFRRDDRDPVYFDTKEAKKKAVRQCILDVNRSGNPILVFMPSIRETRELYEELSKDRRLGEWLIQNKAHLNIIDGQEPEKEADIVGRAGRKCEITIATNAAGRGIHFKLGDGINEQGGLVVIMTYRNKVRRIDSQQRRRTAIRGDNGQTRTFLSWEDEIFERWGRDNPQEKSEALYRELRAKTLKFDEELDQRREEYYRIRNIVLHSGLDPQLRAERLKAMDAVWREFLGNIDKAKNIGSLNKEDAFEKYREVCQRDFSSMIYRLLNSERIGLRSLIPELAGYGVGAGAPAVNPATRPVLVGDLAPAESADLLASILRPQPAGERKPPLIYYESAGQAREFISQNREIFLSYQLNIVTCMGHSFEVRRRLENRGIGSEVFICVDEERGIYHVWIETQDDYIIDSYPLDGGEPHILRRSEDKEGAYKGEKLLEVKEWAPWLMKWWDRVAQAMELRSYEGLEIVASAAWKPSPILGAHPKRIPYKNMIACV